MAAVINRRRQSLDKFVIDRYGYDIDTTIGLERDT